MSPSPSGGPNAARAAAASGSRLHVAAAVVPFLLLVPVLRILPLPPAEAGPVPWSWAVGNGALLLAAFAAHTWCYARWQPYAPRRMLANELFARLWFVAYAVILVGRATPNGLLMLLVALPWALLCWEVHRNDVKRHGYRVAWNLGAWGAFLVGLSLFELVATL